MGKDKKKIEIKRICAWCGETLFPSKFSYNPADEGKVTHGCCEKCLAEQRAELDALSQKRTS